MTNGEAVMEALKTLGPGWHNTRAVMWEMRRKGFQMTTDRARGICKVLCRKGQADMLVDGKRYSFQIRPLGSH